MTETEREFQALFEPVLAGFEATRKAKGAVEHWYRIGSKTLKACFAGEALVPVVNRALEHLSINPANQPDLTVHLWDLASSQGPPPVILDRMMRSLRWHWYCFLNPRGEIKGLIHPDYMAAFHPGPNILSLLDIKKRCAIYWAKDASEVPWHESGSPMRTLLNWWTASQGYQFVHGGAVGLQDKAALIVGKGGTGKSTTCLACLEAGMRYLGDDYTLVRLDDQPWVYSLYNTAKLKGLEDISRFPGLKPLLINPDRLDIEKAMMFLYGSHKAQITPGMPLKAILIPSISNKAQTEIQPASPGAALAALAPSTMFQLPGSTGQAMKNITELVKKLPCFMLKLGTHLESLTNELRQFILGGI
jgi:hypothetical protein